MSFRLKRKGAGAGRKQSKKAAKDPNKPKRPPSAFFVFMYGFSFAFDTESVFVSFRFVLIFFFCVLAIEVFVIVF